jgi:hypothetical protein
MIIGEKAKYGRKRCLDLAVAVVRMTGGQQEFRQDRNLVEEMEETVGRKSRTRA